MGDFSILQDIPEMYRHCKATEDKDMNAMDFVTDHLLNIDGIFDKHENGDEQKPHQTPPSQHQGQTTLSFVSFFTFTITKYFQPEIKPVIQAVHFLPYDYITKIFRPPIV